MNNELLIGLGGLVLMVLAYFAGIQRTKYMFAIDDRENRINRIVDNYVRASQSKENSGLNNLIHSGLANLKNDTEIREAIVRIINHGEKAPYLQIKEYYEDLDLHKYFQEAKTRGYDFLLKGDPVKLALELLNKKN